MTLFLFFFSVVILVLMLMMMRHVEPLSYSFYLSFTLRCAGLLYRYVGRDALLL